MSKHKLLSLAEVQRRMRVVWIIRDVSFVPWRNELSRWYELRAHQNVRLRTSDHMKPEKSIMSHAKAEGSALEEAAEATLVLCLKVAPRESVFNRDHYMFKKQHYGLRVKVV